MALILGGGKTGGALPAQWQVDADGTLNILDEFGTIRATLDASGKLNVYRADGTITAQATAGGSVRVFNATEAIMVSAKTSGRIALSSETLPAFALDVFVSENNPSGGAGIAAPRGSLCLSDGTLFSKYGNGDTNWSQVFTARNQAGHVNPATATAEDIANELIAAGLMA